MMSFTIMFTSTLLLSAVTDADALDVLYETISASAREMGPTLPRYMVPMRIVLPAPFRLEVRFRVRPTVAVALMVS